MKQRQPPSSPWELGKDEIASIASDELHRNRPNRWTGSKSTWRTLTESERLLWQSMKRIEDQDLGIHLYNAFALKRRGLDPETAQDLTVQNENGEESVWAPPKVWTAWPLKESHLPAEEFVTRNDGLDEDFSIRANQDKMPSSDLQEELSALVLRTAKKRFRQRMKKAARVKPSVEVPDDDAPEEESGEDSHDPRSRATSAEGVSEEDEPEEEDGENKPAQTRPKKRRSPQTFDPVVSSNDDLSNKLLTPAIRHIISQLERTLLILHNSRHAGLTYQSDSSTEHDSDAGVPSGSQTPTKKKRGRPRATTPLLPIEDTTTANPSTKTSRRGRPRKVHVPQEGESHEAFLERVARESHRRLPVIQVDPDAAFEEWLQTNANANANDSNLAPSSPATTIGESQEPPKPSQTTNTTRSNIQRWGLRDWSDVVGAASLAGFPSEVIARTAKRCANLFGQSMLIRNLHEVPITQDTNNNSNNMSGGPGVETIQYRPSPIRLSPSSNGDDDDDDSTSPSEDDAASTLLQRRLSSRRSSIARRSAPSSPGLRPNRSSPHLRGRSSHRAASSSSTTGPPRSRSASRCSSVASQQNYFCPVASCDRAASGFSRRTNLRRHIELLHGGQVPQSLITMAAAAAAAADVDSDDEVVGGVHVDGFLKPIVPGKGWRGGDGRPRVPPKKRRKQQSDSDDDNDEY